MSKIKINKFLYGLIWLMHKLVVVILMLLTFFTGGILALPCTVAYQGLDMVYRSYVYDDSVEKQLSVDNAYDTLYLAASVASIYAGAIYNAPGLIISAFLVIMCTMIKVAAESTLSNRPVEVTIGNK